MNNYLLLKEKTLKLIQFKRLFFSMYYFLLSNKFFVLLSDYISFMGYMLSRISNLQVEFYLISNEHVTAAFLSRFIAKKLSQNLSGKKVLNPLKGELKRIMSKTAFMSKQYLLYVKKKFLHLTEEKKNKKYV